ncbi:hypothetical protein OHW97_01905 [Acinetobacter baumannii]|nr:hypothetical protein [Acinetobacter baumannii]
MKPEQFIREWGFEYSRKYVALAESEGDILPWELSLKRLVESLDIIKDLGGIKDAKGTLYNLVQLDWDEFEHRYIDNWMCTRPRLERAIKDHGSIYGGGGDE